jgi:hypothetical protein
LVFIKGVDVSIGNEADKLRQEAKDLLCKLLKFPEGFSSSEVDRFIDCIVGTAILEISATILELNKDNNQNEYSKKM